jgi:hypothetical protein
MSAHQRHRSAFSRALTATPPETIRRPSERPRVPVDVGWLAACGNPVWNLSPVPDTPLLRAAVSVFAGGTPLDTPDGPRRVGELVPGDRLLTKEGGVARLAWSGTVSWEGDGPGPCAALPGPGTPLLRVAADSFGPGLPERDILLGAQAHVLLESPALVELVGAPAAFAPLAAFEDGVSVAPVSPPGEVQVHGLATGGHDALLAANLPVAAFHPSCVGRREIGSGGLAQMAALFPQLDRGPGFGPCRLPYLSAEQAMMLGLP